MSTDKEVLPRRRFTEKNEKKNNSIYLFSSKKRHNDENQTDVVFIQFWKAKNKISDKTIETENSGKQTLMTKTKLGMMNSKVKQFDI